MERPLFEHRHFVWLANYARFNLDPLERLTLASQLEDTNPKFDKERFLIAAKGYPTGRDTVR